MRAGAIIGARSGETGAKTSPMQTREQKARVCINATEGGAVGASAIRSGPMVKLTPQFSQCRSCSSSMWCRQNMKRSGALFRHGDSVLELLHISRRKLTD